MSVVVSLAVQIVVGALLLWGAIGILDKGNYKNTFTTACGWTGLFGILGVIPVFGWVLGLVAFFVACLQYYDMNFLQAIGVAVMECVLAFAVGFAALAVAGGAAAAAG